MECKKCGSLIPDENSKFCHECGTKIPKKNGIFERLKNLNTGPEKEAWPKKIALILFFWGITNMIFTSPFEGSILIFFAVSIFASRSSLAIYAFGIIWLLVALFQLINGVTNCQLTSSASTEFFYILISIVNFIFAGYSIYKTRIVDENEKQREVLV